jgi:Helix-turn-helix domain
MTIMSKRPAKKIRYYSIPQAALALGITRQAVHLAIKKGSLKASERKVTKSEWLIAAEDLEAYTPSNRHQASGKKNN